MLTVASGRTGEAAGVSYPETRNPVSPAGASSRSPPIPRGRAAGPPGTNAPWSRPRPAEPSNTASTRPSSALRIQPGHAGRAGAFRATRAEEHALDASGHDDMHAAHRDSLPQPRGRLRGVTDYDERTALWWSTSRTTSPTRRGPFRWTAATASCRASNAGDRTGARRRGARGLHAGLAPSQHAALLQGRRHLAGTLRAGDLGRRVPSGPRGRGRGRPQGRRRPRRLFRFQRARPRERRDVSDDARGAAPFTRDRAVGRSAVWRRTTACWRPCSTRGRSGSR